jgi:SAM-dependent methyltransferase
VRRLFGAAGYRRLRRILGYTETPWCRVAMGRATRELVSALPCNTLDVIEISGSQWASAELGFRSYRTASFPEFDICAAPLGEEICDLVIAEQVFEHIERPHAAARHAYAMLRPQGTVLITTPFLLKHHAFPRDLYRWSEDGLRVLLEDAGFRNVVTGSWGNRRCLRADLTADLKWTMYHPLLHTLHNEPQFPISVWATGSRCS